MKSRTKIIILLLIVATLSSITYYYYPDILGYYLLHRARQSYEPIVKTGDYFSKTIELNPFHRVNPFANIYFNPFNQHKYQLKFQYPVIELDSCSDQVACANYCQQNENIKKCAYFSFNKGLINNNQLAITESLSKMLEEKHGPGNCRDIEDCKSYCNQKLNIDTCVEIYRLYGLLSTADLLDAERINKAVVFGMDLPGKCFTENECEAYCSNPSSMLSCLGFAEISGFLSQIEITAAKKLINIYKQGTTPGNCTSRNSCLNYCQSEGNIEECINFLERNSLISSHNAELGRTHLGRGPAGCWTKEDCDTYCYHPVNLDQCLDYAILVGRINEKELEIINKILDKDRNKPLDFFFEYIND